jgi:hypothetical protein
LRELKISELLHQILKIQILIQIKNQGKEARANISLCNKILILPGKIKKIIISRDCKKRKMK